MNGGHFSWLLCKMAERKTAASYRQFNWLYTTKAKNKQNNCINKELVLTELTWRHWGESSGKPELRWTDWRPAGNVHRGPWQPSAGVLAPNSSEHLRVTQRWSSWSALYNKHTKSNKNELILSHITVNESRCESLSLSETWPGSYLFFSIFQMYALMEERSSWAQSR